MLSAMQASLAKAGARACSTVPIPLTMRAVQVEGSRKAAVASVVAGVPTPEPGPGEVLIKVAASGVNRPDLLQKAGLYPAPPGASPVLGLEIAGHVAACGPGATLAIGTPVMALANGGGYAEFATVPAGQALHLPTDSTGTLMPFDVAAAVPETLLTCWYNLVYLGGLAPGRSLLVHGGTSGIGSMAIRLAAAMGCRAIFTTAGSPVKAAVALGLGAHAAVDYTAGDFSEALKGSSAAWGRVTGHGAEEGAQHPALYTEIMDTPRPHSTALGGRVQAACHPPSGAELVGSTLPHRAVGSAVEAAMGATEANDGLDVVLDMVGGDYIGRNLSLLGTGGRHVSVAFQRGSKTQELDLMRVMLKRLVLTGSTLRSRPDAFKAALVSDVAAVLASDDRLLAPAAGSSQWSVTPEQAREQGGVSQDAPLLAPLLGRAWDAGQVQEAHEALGSGATAGKHVLVW